MDTTTSGGKLVFQIFGALAEFERSLIRERTMAGLAAARSRGRVGGRPPVMTPEKIKVARDLYRARELTVEEIANTVGVSRKTVYRHLVDSPRTDEIHLKSLNYERPEACSNYHSDKCSAGVGKDDASLAPESSLYREEGRRRMSTPRPTPDSEPGTSDQESISTELRQAG